MLNSNITELTVEEAIAYLKDANNFSKFSDGLKKLMKDCGYTGKTDIDSLANFLYQQLLELPEKPITKQTIQDWFTDKRKPELDSTGRKEMYMVCFALHANLEQVKWFFHYVYFDKNLNCHTIEEAVYYYCLKNNQDYGKALELIKEIESFPDSNTPIACNPIFTREIQNAIDNFSDDSELLDFFQKNKKLFLQWNTTAFKNMMDLISEIQAKETDQIVLDTIKNKGISSVSQKDIDACGLIIQEYIYDIKSNKNIIISNKGRHITSKDFMLDRILSFKIEEIKNMIVPENVRHNFPRKQILSNLLHKATAKTSYSIKGSYYNAFRIYLILFSFYDFWCHYLLDSTIMDMEETEKEQDNMEFPDEYGNIKSFAFHQYLDETNALLSSCDYSELYLGNPFDWLFLWAAAQVDKKEQPLSALRSAIPLMYDAEL